MPDYTRTVHGRKYIGPFKWIVCLLGNDIYPVNTFSLQHRHELQNSLTNLSISMMTLSAEPKRYHRADYQKLCRMTREGIFTNLTSRDSAQHLAEQFFTQMDVYPSSRKLVIREFFRFV